MRGNSKHGYHHHRSNKRYKKQIVQVLLDNSSDGGLVFVKQRQAHVASLLEKARFHTRGILRMGSPKTKRKARVELNFFNYSNSKWYYSEPDVVMGKGTRSCKHGLILGNKP